MSVLIVFPLGVIFTLNRARRRQTQILVDNNVKGLLMNKKLIINMDINCQKLWRPSTEDTIKWVKYSRNFDFVNTATFIKLLIGELDKLL